METVTLKSGREVLLRPIRPDDGPRLKTGYRALSAQSQYQRFLALKPRLTDADVRYLGRLDAKVAETDELTLMPAVAGG